jgi:hypothetical protein
VAYYGGLDISIKRPLADNGPAFRSEERAECRLARSLLGAWQAEAAVVPAQRCVDVCLHHGAPASELFFDYAVLGIVPRAARRTVAFARSQAMH